MADRMSSKDVASFEELSGEPVELIEITGVVKWFDVAKGFGFIVPDNGMQDVLLHVTCLRRDGYQTILEGTRIVAMIQRLRGRPKRLESPASSLSFSAYWSLIRSPRYSSRK